MITTKVHGDFLAEWVSNPGIRTHHGSMRYCRGTPMYTISYVFPKVELVLLALVILPYQPSGAVRSSKAKIKVDARPGWSSRPFLPRFGLSSLGFGEKCRRSFCIQHEEFKTPISDMCDMTPQQLRHRRLALTTPSCGPEECCR